MFQCRFENLYGNIGHIQLCLRSLRYNYGAGIDVLVTVLVVDADAQCPGTSETETMERDKFPVPVGPLIPETNSAQIKIVEECFNKHYRTRPGTYPATDVQRIRGDRLRPFQLAFKKRTF